MNLFDFVISKCQKKKPVENNKIVIKMQFNIKF